MALGDNQPPGNGGYWAGLAGIVMMVLTGLAGLWQSLKKTKREDRVDAIKEWIDYGERMRIERDKAHKENHELRNEMFTKVNDLFTKNVMCEAELRETRKAFEEYKRLHP